MAGGVAVTETDAMATTDPPQSDPSRVEGVRLMAGSGAPGSWRTVAAFALG